MTATVAGIADLLAEGEVLLLALREETLCFAGQQAGFEEAPTEEFRLRRESLLDGLEKIDVALSDRLVSCKTPEIIQSLAVYRELRDATYTEVLTLDKDIVERAQEKLKSLSVDFASLAQGKKALHGYRPASGKMPGCLDREA